MHGRRTAPFLAPRHIFRDVEKKRNKLIPLPFLFMQGNLSAHISAVIDVSLAALDINHIYRFNISRYILQERGNNLRYFVARKL